MDLTLRTPVAALSAGPAWLMHRAARLAASTARALERRRRIARIVAELGAMSDRDLADLGIPRCDIGRIARDAVYGS